MSIDAEATRGVDEAYVVVAAGVAPDGERVDRERAGQRRPIVFVPDESVAPRVVVGLVAEGIDLVELYGGFGPTSAAAVSAAIGGRARRLRGDHRGPGDRRGRAAGARGGGELRRRGPRRRGRLLGSRGGLGRRPSMTGRAAARSRGWARRGDRGRGPGTGGPAAGRQRGPQGVEPAGGPIVVRPSAPWDRAGRRRVLAAGRGVSRCTWAGRGPGTPWAPAGWWPEAPARPCRVRAPRARSPAWSGAGRSTAGARRRT